MRVVFFSLDFGLVILALVALLQIQGTIAGPRDTCPPENCMSSEKCDEAVRSAVKCENSADTCCSIVKSEFRTACRHHGGECMDRCNPSLMRTVNDCPAGQNCCVLV